MGAMSFSTTGMKVLSIGTDRKLFEKDSGVFWRQMDYSAKSDMHIVVFSLKGLGLKESHQGNLHIYPTNSISKLLYIFDAIRLGKKIIRENGFKNGNSVISTQDPFETGKVGLILKKIFGFPLQVQVHTDFLDPHFKNSFFNRIRIIIANFIIPNADGIRVVSSAVSESIKNKFPKLKIDVDILPVFVNAQSIFDNNEETSAKKWKFNIVMASRLAAEKRIDIALLSLKRVIKASPEAGLTIIGSGPEKDDLLKKVNVLGLGKNVLFLDWQNNLIPYYKSADIFLLTSEYEGYSIALIEAGASGCPIVTTKVGVAKTDLFKDGINSFVCPVGEVECLSTHIIELISNPGKRESFKINMRDSIKGIAISKEEYTANYIGLLEKLLNNV